MFYVIDRRTLLRRSGDVLHVRVRRTARIDVCVNGDAAAGAARASPVFSSQRQVRNVPDDDCVRLYEVASLVIAGRPYRPLVAPIGTEA
jgi:hypothetical protein